MESSDRIEQPRVFEVRFYVLPSYKDSDGIISPCTVAAVTAEVVNGQHIGFGPIVREVMPETPGLAADLLRGLGANMGTRLAQRIREGT